MSNENIVFVDIETTGLHTRNGHRPWEVGIIDVHGEVLVNAMWKPSDEVMAKADSMALSIGGYYDRIADPDTRSMRQNSESWVASQVANVVRGKTLCGAAVHFDAHMLDVWLREHGHVGTWSHRLLEIGSYVAGATGHAGPASLGDTASRADVTYESEKKHTAYYDAELARRCWLAVQSLHGHVLPKKDDKGRMPTPPPMGTGT